MIYIKKKILKNPSSISAKTAEIKRSEEWKNLPDVAPSEEDSAADYTRKLRDMFEEFPKEEIRKNLVEEQHGLCCYCMRRIADSGLQMRIEHWFPLNKDKTKAIEYSNFLGACTGKFSQNSRVYPCCDNSKSGSVIELNPQDQRMMDQIAYESNGRIYFQTSNAWTETQVRKFQEEIDKILQLNGKIDGSDDAELKSKRESVYRSCRERLEKLRLRKDLKISEVQKLVDRIEKSDEYPEYAGVMLFYYKRWIRNHK